MKRIYDDWKKIEGVNMRIWDYCAGFDELDKYESNLEAYEIGYAQECNLEEYERGIEEANRGEMARYEFNLIKKLKKGVLV